jgi:acyl dehydratase
MQDTFKIPSSAGVRLPSQELTSFVGQTVDTSVFEVEKEPIRRFADAVGDMNPLYWDEEYARRSRFGSIIAPPGFVSSLWFSGRSAPWGPRERPSEALGPPALMDALVRAGYKRILDTGIDYEFYEPVKAGDMIRLVCVVKDIMERGASDARVAFLITETTYTNQAGQAVAKAKSTTVHQ